MTEMYCLAAIVGLCIGSFLNVVIYRLPKMLLAQWQEQPLMNFNLMYPSSHCPHCQHVISPKYNIPLLGYLFLKGRCADCSERISPRYFLIESLTAIVTVFAIYYSGLSWPTIFALLFSYSLICLAMIDIEHQILPDIITIPLIWIGLLLSFLPSHLSPIATSSADAILGAIVGYLSLWSFAKLFQLIRGKEGMGYGDFKLFAALGAWLGWQMLPMIILLASLMGSIGGIMTLYFNRQNQHTPIPFGPYLAIAAWIGFYFGHDIINNYLKLMELN